MTPNDKNRNTGNVPNINNFVSLCDGLPDYCHDSTNAVSFLVFVLISWTFLLCFWFLVGLGVYTISLFRFKHIHTIHTYICFNMRGVEENYSIHTCDRPNQDT